MPIGTGAAILGSAAISGLGSALGGRAASDAADAADVAAGDGRLASLAVGKK